MTRFARAAGIRYRTGETSLLENATAQLQLNQTSNLIVQNQADVRIYQQVLQTLLNSGEPIGIADTVLTKRALSLALDSSLLAQNPSLAYQRQQVEVSGRSKEVEKARLLPDFTLGYFNQSLTGIQSVGGQEQYFGPDKRFTGFQVGISLPLWFRPQAARIQAAALNQKLAQSDFELARKNLAGQLAQAGQEYLKYRSSLDYYEQNALPQAELILEKAQKAFQSGEIGYVEFTQGINSALGIRSSYLDILNQYNQSVLALELLAGIR
jgi:heavy metal efflux system protein